MRLDTSIKDIPGVVDYVISCAPASQVLGLLEDCCQKGVKAVHLFTARFSETGREEAAELEHEILKLARKGGIRIIGPNCLGVYYPREGISFNSDLPKEFGSVGLVSQSGQLLHQIVFLAAQKGLRFSKAISYGNALDFNECDYLEYFAQDPETKIIMMYIEGVRDGRRFFNSLRDTSAAKPVIILKGGMRKAGARATASHTASLAGSVEVWQTMVRQAGAVAAAEMEELIDLTTAFYYLPPIRGRKVGIAGGGGGASVLAADQCEEAGLDVIPLPVEIREELKAKGSPVWDWIGNPADISIAWGEFDPGAIMQMMAVNENFDFLILFVDAPWQRPAGRSIKNLIEEHMKRLRLGEVNKPLLVVFQEGGRSSDSDSIMQKMMKEIKIRLIAANLPIYPNIGRAARTASKIIDYYQRSK